MNTCLIRILMLLCFSINVSFSAEGLFDIYALALKADPTLRQSQLDYDIVVEQKHQDFSRWLPSISLSGDMTDNSQKRTYDVSQFDGEESYSSYGYSLSISQPLFRYENNVIYQQATDKVNQANISLRATQQALIIRMSERYFEILAATDNLGFINAEKISVKRQLTQAEGRLKAGLSAITDVYEAKAQLDSTIADVIEAKNQYENSLESLREITNRYHEKLRPLRVALELVEPPIVGVEKWIILALNNNPDILRLQHINQQLQHDVKRQRAAHYPTLDLVARYAKTTSGGGSFGNSNTENRTIGLQFSLPIYQGGAVTSRTKSAVLKHERNLEKLDATMRSVRRQVHKSYRGIMANIARVKSLAQSVISNEKALNAVETENKLGMRTITDVFQVNRKLYRARRDYQRARYDYVLNRLRLKQSVGNLSALDLKQIDRWLGTVTQSRNRRQTGK